MKLSTIKSAISLFFAALGLALCPLLAAQQVRPAIEPVGTATPTETLFAYRSSLNLRAELPFDSSGSDPSGTSHALLTIPYKVAIELTPVDPTSWARAAVGSILTFRVVRNTIVWKGLTYRSPYAYANAGDSIQAKVIRVRQGKTPTRQGKAAPHVKELLVGKSLKLELESSARRGPRFSAFAKNLLIWSVKGPVLAAVYLVEVPLLMIACSTSGCDL